MWDIFSASAVSRHAFVNLVIVGDDRLVQCLLLSFTVYSWFVSTPSHAHVIISLPGGLRVSMFSGAHMSLLARGPGLALALLSRDGFAWQQSLATRSCSAALLFTSNRAAAAQGSQGRLVHCLVELAQPRPRTSTTSVAWWSLLSAILFAACLHAGGLWPWPSSGGVPAAINVDLVPRRPIISGPGSWPQPSKPPHPGLVAR